MAPDAEKDPRLTEAPKLNEADVKFTKQPLKWLWNHKGVIFRSMLYTAIGLVGLQKLGAFKYLGDKVPSLKGATDVADEVGKYVGDKTADVAGKGVDLADKNIPYFKDYVSDPSRNFLTAVGLRKGPEKIPMPKEK